VSRWHASRSNPPPSLYYLENRVRLSGLTNAKFTYRTLPVFEYRTDRFGNCPSSAGWRDYRKFERNRAGGYCYSSDGHFPSSRTTFCRKRTGFLRFIHRLEIISFRGYYACPALERHVSGFPNFGLVFKENQRRTIIGDARIDAPPRNF